MSLPRLIAFYLPQFHPTPENDAWWGKGFTEWTNVTKARPLFLGHYQPHLPTDLGFYDLRVRQARHEQARLARQHGISAFCYHYYWFSGQRVLHQPLFDMLADSDLDMPFCLCWANENWTRRWDGQDQQVLLAQKHLPDDPSRFFRDIEPFLRDPRYLRYEGKLFLIVYRPQLIRRIRDVARVWRDHCRRAGLGDLHLCAAFTHGNHNYREFDFDSGVEFPPHNFDVRQHNLNHRINFDAAFKGCVCAYERFAQTYLERRYGDQSVFRTVMPSWDNSPRVGERAFLLLNASPDNYEHWLSETIRHMCLAFGERESLVFINAWNEWAEGCHLEPDRRYGLAWLEATKRVWEGTSKVGEFSTVDMALIQLSDDKRSFMSDLSSLVGRHFSRAMHRANARLIRHPRLRGLLTDVKRTLVRVLANRRSPV